MPAVGKHRPTGSGDAEFIDDVFAHSLLFNLSPQDKRLPSYVPAANFSQAVLDVARQRLALAGHAAGGARELFAAINSGPWRTALAPLANEVQGDAERFRRRLEDQYDQMMDRVAGWYKRNIQWWMLAYGLVIAVLLNVDAGQIASQLWRDPVARAAMVDAVAQVPTEVKADPARLREAVVALDPMSSLPLGWPTRWWSAAEVTPMERLAGFAASLAGWLLTALAATLGAPFWFDVVGKLVQLRGAGAKPARSTDTAQALEARDARAAKPSRQPTSASVAAGQVAEERNALIELYAQRNRDDPAYRPVQAEERW